QAPLVDTHHHTRGGPRGRVAARAGWRGVPEHKPTPHARRLAELAQRMGKAAYLIDDASDIQEAWVKDAACVGVTAGASAPDILVQNVITRLQELGGGEAVPLEGREENIVFEVPKELRVDVREVE
ncbi:hypothetical protein M8371_28410, partial [Klebsiella pneumoniae]|nr:hypothetical protein [Klebsiella pneumoniae]